MGPWSPSTGGALGRALMLCVALLPCQRMPCPRHGVPAPITSTGLDGLLENPLFSSQTHPIFSSFSPKGNYLKSSL